MEFRRKIYTRGSSYETTIPMPLLFSIDKGKKYTAIFLFEAESGKWIIRIEEEKQENGKQSKNERKK
jgi:hypothetical protein